MSEKICSDKRAWHTGQCCCNCKYQCMVVGHPWNPDGYKNKEFSVFGCGMLFATGQIEGHTGMIAPGAIGEVYLQAWEGSGHGMCEMHTERTV